jgi:hypothetical protein
MATYDIAAMRERAIESEATTWLHGDTERAARMFDRSAEWARKLDTAGRRYHAAGAWYANQITQLTAINIVQIGLGERPGFTEEPQG